MNVKTMEGLVGARTNLNLLDTPFRVYKEARRKGDTATMERAMGYVNEFSDKAEEYKAKAEEGIKEDAEAAREKEELEREKNKDTDTVKVSEEGKALLKENPVTDGNDLDRIDMEHPAYAKERAGKEPVIYTKTGEAAKPELAINISISV